MGAPIKVVSMIIGISMQAINPMESLAKWVPPFLSQAKKVLLNPSAVPGVKAMLASFAHWIGSKYRDFVCYLTAALCGLPYKETKQEYAAGNFMH